LTLGSNTTSFVALSTTVPETQTASTVVPIAKAIFIQGASNTSGAANVGGITALYPTSSPGPNWGIVQKLIGTGAGTTAAYTLYYYAVN
jgi:hypothetical protein